MRRLACAGLVLAPFLQLASGCKFIDASDQIARLNSACEISGRVSTTSGERRPVVVVLLRQLDGQAATQGNWDIEAHFVMEQPGKWQFLAKAGNRYAAVAFGDSNQDFAYQRGEPYGHVAVDNPIACAPGGRYPDLAITVPPPGTSPASLGVDLGKLEARSASAQVGITLFERTVLGEVVSLSDPRFTRAIAEDSLWRPLDFVMDSRPGIYFLEKFSPAKVPVLFVHGINGSPANFAYLVEKLDRSRFQPWVYYYPSGVHLATVADHLNETMAMLQIRHRFPRYAVVAHSMGGLVSRGFIIRDAETAEARRIPLYVTLSTPWAGHSAAELGVRYSPVVVQVWQDMAPGSAYLRSLYARPLPDGMAHHLLVTSQRSGRLMAATDDGVVTVASQMYGPAYREAARVYEMDDSHDGILRNKEASALLNDLLGRSF